MPFSKRRRSQRLALLAAESNLNKDDDEAAQQEGVDIQAVDGPEPMALDLYGGEPKQNPAYGEQQQTPPSVIIPWIFKEVTALENRLQLSHQRDTSRFSFLIPEENKQERVLMRKTQYPAFAEALLQSWLHEGGESFKEVFCEQTWGVVAGYLPSDAAPFAKVPEVEIFLEEFLGGGEFGLSTKVTVGGRCGDQLVPSVFRAFEDKVRTAGVQNLHLKTILRAQNFLHHLVKGHHLPLGEGTFSYRPEWAIGPLLSQRWWTLQSQYGGLYSEFEMAVNNCSVKQEADRAKQEKETRLTTGFRNSLMQRAPKGPG